MISTETRELLEHLEWADAKVCSAVLGLEAATADTRVRELLSHSTGVLWAYLHLWRGEPLDMPKPEELGDLRAVAGWARRYHEERASYTAGLEDAELERTVEFPWAEQLVRHFGQVHPTTLRQSMLQVALHSAYHRGQVNTRLKELGGEPPLVDFVAWIWAGRPAAEWPAGT